MTVALPDTTKGLDLVGRVLSVGTSLMLTYSFYETLYVIDGSAQDFIAASTGFWVVAVANIFLPLSLLLGITLYHAVRRNALFHILLIFFLPSILGPIVIIALFASSGGQSAVIACLLYLTQKFWELRSNHVKVLKDLVITFISVFIAMILASILDSFLRSNELYMLVLEDTLSHMPEGVRYGASPPLTNNVHPLMFYTLLMSMLFFDKFGERILKGIIWLNTKESVDNKTDFES